PQDVIDDFKYFIEKTDSPLPFKVCRPDTLTHWVKEFLREAKLSEDLHCHSLRHTCITLGLEEGGMSFRDMQKYADHSSGKVTEMYAHELVKKAPKLLLE
ncbi:tyrosine-type recombinase/integrase, partial [Candidatus Latescibacterota bacterium]